MKWITFRFCRLSVLFARMSNLDYYLTNYRVVKLYTMSTNSSGEEFFKDYRINTQTEAEWVLTYQQGKEDQLTLTWGIKAEQMEGSLILSSTQLDEEVNMVEHSNVTFTGDGSGSFTIVYTTRDN